LDPKKPTSFGVKLLRLRGRDGGREGGCAGGGCGDLARVERAWKPVETLGEGEREGGKEGRREG